jgi:hypothetical protein
MLNSPLSHLNVIIQSLSPYLAKGSITERELPKIRRLLDIFFEVMPYPKYHLRPATLIRATINKNIPEIGNTIINEIKFLKYPPKDKVFKYGRCNTTNMSVLYGAFSKLTATKELKFNNNDIITFTEWVRSNDDPLIAFPIFFNDKDLDGSFNEISLSIKVLHENFISGKSEDEKKYYNISMRFLANCFSKEVDPDNHFDYFLSSYLSQKIFENKNQNYELILYPSVVEKLGFSNMAVKPEVFDKKFIIKEVNTDYPLGISGEEIKGVNFFNIKSAESFDLESGIIQWK